MMNNRLKWMAALGLATLVAGFSGCKEEDREYNGNLDLNQLDFTQAREVWDGQECNRNYVLAYDENKPAKNISVKLHTSLYQDRVAEKEATVKLIVDSDSLAQTIAKVPEGGAYKKYANAIPLPEEFYMLDNDKLTLRTGEKLSDKIVLSVYASRLIDMAQTEKKDFVYVLPLKIINSSSYGINEHTDALMLIFTVSYVKLSDDPHFWPDTKGVPDDHTLDNGMKLLWHDEFNDVGAPNPEMWSFETGFLRNEEDQWYQAGNALMKGGALVFTGKKEAVKNPNYQAGSSDWKKNREYAEYTSSCIVTNKQKYVFKYGRVEVRAKIPVEQGAWPAIWSTGNWYEWPLGGEIDILEFYKEKIHANVCWGGNKRWEGSWNSYNRLFSEFKAKDKTWASQFHIWRMDWDDKFIKLYLDDELLNQTDLSTTFNKGDHGAGDGGFINPYSNDFEGFGQRMMLNLAIGGINGRPIQAKFPLEYHVDYIRVYQTPK